MNSIPRIGIALYNLINHISVLHLFLPVSPQVLPNAFPCWFSCFIHGVIPNIEISKIFLLSLIKCIHTRRFTCNLPFNCASMSTFLCLLSVDLERCFIPPSYCMYVQTICLQAIQIFSNLLSNFTWLPVLPLKDLQ